MSLGRSHRRYWPGRGLCSGVDGNGAAKSRAEDGAAIIEFAMVSIVLIFLLFAVLQVAVYAYIRHVVIADAANGARYAASAGMPIESGASRANGLIASHLGTAAAKGLTCTASATVDQPTGLRLVSVHCRGAIRSIFLPVGTFLTLDISTSVLKEPTP